MSTAIHAVNHQVRLASRPTGLPTEANWQLTEEPVGDPPAGSVLVQVLALSLDPAMRGWMNEGRSYIRPVEIGEVMRAGGIGRVVASQAPGFAAGDLVAGTFGVQEYWAASAEQLPKSGLHKIDTRLGQPILDGLPLGIAQIDGAAAAVHRRGAGLLHALLLVVVDRLILAGVLGAGDE